MSQNESIILSVVHRKLPVAQVAKQFGVSRAWVYKLLARYQKEGRSAFVAASRRPLTNPRATSRELSLRICQIRMELLRDGLDAGPQSISYRLIEQGQNPPSLATIWRILSRQGLVTPEPKKKPKTYLQRFEAQSPNETWQADFTHVRIAKNQDILVLNFLDDHSRFLLACTAYSRITADTIVDRFADLVNEFGVPRSTLTDNGLVFTTRLIKGRNSFEYLLDSLGVEQKNSRPHHPQTQGKVERFHQTLKRWLGQRPEARNIRELQRLLDEFREVYNQKRPHRALHGATPSFAYRARPRVSVASSKHKGRNRILFQRVDQTGKVTVRRAGTLHYLGIGRSQINKEVLLMVSPEDVIVTDKFTGEVLSEHLIEPTKRYWAKKETPRKNPKRF
jgi:transposase InsO family protein